MFNWFSRKKEADEIRKETKKGFEAVKDDINSISEWIKHLDSEKNKQQEDLIEIKELLSTMQEEIDGMKNIVSIIGDVNSNRVFKTPTRAVQKQTAVYAVQTGVQTPNLDQFSTTERAILWILLNSDMKLSYDDLAAILGKERSTIRGQINRIKQKSEIIEEQIEQNGKKRVFIPEEIREKMLKKSKVRVKSDKKPQKIKKIVKRKA